MRFAVHRNTLFILTLFATTVYAGAPDQEALRIDGITVPAQTVSLGAVPEGRIAKLAVEEDQTVSAGEVLLSLDDRVQALRTAIARVQAEATADVDLARLRLEQARGEFERLNRLGTDGFATSKELDDARLDADMARLQFDIVSNDQRQSELDYQRAQAMLDEYHIKAPFDGYVTRILKRPGDTVSEREAIIVLIQLDPLEVTVDCPIDMAPHVRHGQRVMVRPQDPQWPPRAGEVFTVSRAADPASQTFRVRIRVPNGDQSWISGLKVEVDFGGAAKLADAAK